MTFRTKIEPPDGEEVRACLPLGLEALFPYDIEDSKLMLFRDNERVASLILYWRNADAMMAENTDQDRAVNQAILRHGYRVLRFFGGEARELENGSAREEVLVRILQGTK